MKTQVMQVTNDSGITFNVVFTMQYGRDHTPVVRFYDARYQGSNHEPWREYGQPVSTYGIATMAAHRGGLCLEGGVPAWYVDETALGPVVNKAGHLLYQFIKDAMYLHRQAKAVLSYLEGHGLDTGMGGPLSDLRDAVANLE